MLTLPASCPPPSATCFEEAAEIRYLDTEGTSFVSQFVNTAPSFEEPAMNTILDGRVEQLATSDFDDSGPIMKELQDELRRGNRRMAQMLAMAIRERRFDPDARGLALETLAGARVRWFEPQTVELVRMALDAPEPELHFAGIAAASDLSRTQQVAMSRVIGTLAAFPDIAGFVKSAAEAFLRHVNGSTLPSCV